MNKLYAHALYDRLPDELFQVKFDWDPTLIFFLFMAIFYFRALRLFKKQPVRKWQIVSFYSGVFILIAALMPPIDPLADQLFWVHMVQHLFISHVGVPLMLFGVPFFVMVRGFPLWVRKKVYFPLLASPVTKIFNKTIARPLPAMIFFEVNYWFWHIPRFYNLALMNDFYHLLEHACFALSSILLWRNIIDPHPMKAPLPLPARILMLGFIMALNIILSAILTFSDDLLYAYQGIPMPSWFAHWGHLQDQRLGGLIMWVPGGLVNLIAMTAVFFVWAKSEGARDLNLRPEEKLST